VVDQPNHIAVLELNPGYHARVVHETTVGTAKVEKAVVVFALLTNHGVLSRKTGVGQAQLNVGAATYQDILRQWLPFAGRFIEQRGRHGCGEG
jgi:hypothetical protein